MKTPSRLATSACTVLLALCLMTVSSCRQGRGGTTADTPADAVNWEDSAAALSTRANNYFNSLQLDSLELFVPEAKQICLDHGQTVPYYQIWTTLTELYIASDDFEKGSAEAKLMMEDALRRHSAYGLSSAYKMLGLGYAFSENFSEGVKYLRKAVDTYPQNENKSELISTFNYLYQTLEQLGDTDAIDTLLVQWKSVLDNYPVAGTGKAHTSLNLWRFQYLALLAKYLMEEKKDYASASLMLDSAEYYLGSHADPINQERLYYIRGTLARCQGNYEQSLDYISRYQKAATDINDVSSQKLALYEQSQTYAQSGRYHEALKAYMAFTDLKDSLTSVDDREQLNELNKRFEVSELKMAAERRQMAAERRQLYLVIALVLIILIAVVAFTCYRRRADRKLAAMKAAQERIESELRIARDIQMSMVPRVFPERQGLDMYAAMTPAKEVGGDLYGYVLQGDSLYFAIGDVSGKGVPASLFMAQATRLFRTLAAQQMKPAEICTRMNDALSGEDNENSMFVTFFLGLVDLKTGHLDFCNAGHNPPVLRGAPDHSASFLDVVPNAPIGLWPGLQYEGEELDTIGGRSLFLYTDGLNEAENTEQKQFGDEHMLSILSSHRSLSARQVIEHMTAQVEQHRNGAAPNDDLTMMCLTLNLNA